MNPRRDQCMVHKWTWRFRCNINASFQGWLSSKTWVRRS